MLSRRECICRGECASVYVKGSVHVCCVEGMYVV